MYFILIVTIQKIYLPTENKFNAILCISSCIISYSILQRFHMQLYYSYTVIQVLSFAFREFKMQPPITFAYVVF